MRMDVLRAIITVVYVIICIALIVLVLMQESKSSGLSGAIGGAAADTYWGKNKGRSMEGAMMRVTKVLAAAFIILSIVLNLM